MHNRVSNWPRGKMLGGCSSSNATIAVRGDPGIPTSSWCSFWFELILSSEENYNAWERMGCKGWNYDTLLPYFKKLENCVVPNRDLKYRGVGGTFALSCLPPSLHVVVSCRTCECKRSSQRGYQSCIQSLYCCSARGELCCLMLKKKINI